MLLVSAASASRRWSPPSAWAGPGAHPVAGASTMGWRRVPSRGRGLGQQVSNSVHSLSFHKASCLAGACIFISQSRNPATQVSSTALYPKPKCEISLSGFGVCLLAPSPFPRCLSLLSFASRSSLLPCSGFLQLNLCT